MRHSKLPILVGIPGIAFAIVLNCWITFAGEERPRTNPMMIDITSPSDGATIDRVEIIVIGEVISSVPEFMVTVNGIVAEVNNEKFAAARVPLKKGANLVIATATDAGGNSESNQITVNTDIGKHCLVELDTDITNGAAPLEVEFYIEYSYPQIPARITSAAMDWEGDGTNDFTPKSVKFTHTYTSEGLYFPVVTLTDETGSTYQDQQIINVFPKPNLEAMWNEMRAKLKSGDIEGALECFCNPSRERYREIFTVLKHNVVDIAEDLPDLEGGQIRGHLATFSIKRKEEIEGKMRQIGYSVTFGRDIYGNWCIDSF